MTQGELGALMGIAPSILVQLLNPLDEDGRITRQRDRADRRRHVVALTTAGKKQLRQLLLILRDRAACLGDTTS